MMKLIRLIEALIALNVVQLLVLVKVLCCVYAPHKWWRRNFTC